MQTKADTLKATSGRDIVTVVRDPANTLGKHFTIKADGTIDKKAAVSVAHGTAVMHHVPDADAFAALLREVQDDPHAALILSVVPGIEVGVEFVILSAERLAARLSCSKDDRENLAGVHMLDSVPTIARLKENFLPSTWCLADRDVDQHTPVEFRGDYSTWLAQADRLLPGVASVDRVRVASASQRVSRTGEPVGAGNGHTFFRVANPDDIDRVRVALRVRAIEQGLAWRKPRHGKKTGEVVGYADAAVIDLSVLQRGRLVFDGAPTAGPGLVVGAPMIEVHHGTRRTVDTTAVEMPTAARVREVGQSLGLDLRASGDGASLRIDSFDLRLDTVLETQDFGEVPLDVILLAAGRQRTRCQAPYRASESMAAFLNFTSEGRPFVHDSGTGTNHYLAADEWEPMRDADVLADLPGAEENAASEAARRDTDAAITKAKAARFTPQPWSIFSAGAPPTWIVHGVLPQAELAVIYGESGSGKTFFVLDLVAAIARGVQWRQKRVKAGRVVYIVAEGAGGFRKRLQAYARVHSIGEADMALQVIADAPDLLGDDYKALGTAIGAADVIVVDTLAQTTAGGNENSGEDMGKALAHCKALHRATGALILLVHHSGKDAARGARGWSGLKAACDAELEVTRNGDDRAARVSKLKDGEEGGVFAFKLQPVMLSFDGDGEVTSCTVVASAAAASAKAGPKGAVQKQVLEVAQGLLGTSGRTGRTGLIEQAVAVMPVPAQGERDQRRKGVVRALQALIDSKHLAADGDDIVAPEVE